MTIDRSSKSAMGEVSVGLIAAAWFLTGCGERAALGQSAGGSPVVVCNVKVLSDKVPDVSSLEAWKKWAIKDGMSDRERALAVWKTIVSFQYQNMPPVEFLQNENTVLDPIKMFNVYGYSFCGVAAAEVEALARYAGLKARGWTIKGHIVPEVMWDGQWHMLDASLVNYFPKEDGQLASVAEIVQAVQDWLAKNPEYKANDAKLREFQRADGWSGWRKGPPLLAQCPFYDAGGWWPAKTHGWYATMQEYDGLPTPGNPTMPFLYESGYSLSYRLNVQLREGERLVRNWANKGLHVNRDGAGETPGCITRQPRFEAFTAAYGDLAPGRVGNGTLEYDVPLTRVKPSAWRYENLRVEGTGLRTADVDKPGILEIRMPSSYVYLTGELAFQAAASDGATVGVYFSDNNGLDWRPVTKVDAAGLQKADLKSLVFRRYDYLLRFVLKGKQSGIDNLKIRHDIQHSQRSLPILDQGDNTIAFAAGPQEGTVTVEGSGIADNRPRQLSYLDFDPQLVNIDKTRHRVAGNGPGTGSITFPVKTPGDMVRLRLGVFYRGWDPKDGWDIDVSLDGGKTFKTVCPFGSSDRFNSRYCEVTDLPAGTRSALVRYSGTQKNTLSGLMDFHINADYRMPGAGFRPVKITYLWEEGGIDKEDVHIAKQAEETYRIRCETKPLMKSLLVELAK